MHEISFEEINVNDYFFIDEKIAKISYHSASQHSPQLSVGYKFYHEIGTLPVNAFWTSLQARIQGILITDQYLKALGFVQKEGSLYVHEDDSLLQYGAAGITYPRYVHQLQHATAQQRNIHLKLDMRSFMD